VHLDAGGCAEMHEMIRLGSQRASRCDPLRRDAR
jgi:hypothetical protein